MGSLRQRGQHCKTTSLAIDVEEEMISGDPFEDRCWEDQEPDDKEFDAGEGTMDYYYTDYVSTACHALRYATACLPLIEIDRFVFCTVSLPFPASFFLLFVLRGRTSFSWINPVLTFFDRYYLPSRLFAIFSVEKVIVAWPKKYAFKIQCDLSITSAIQDLETRVRPL